MLNQMSMKMRVLLLPGVAAAGFVMMYGVYLLFAAQHVALLADVRDVHAAAAKHQTETAAALSSYQNALDLAEAGGAAAAAEVLAERSKVMSVLDDDSAGGGADQLWSQQALARFTAVARGHQATLAARSDGGPDQPLERDGLRALQLEVDGRLTTSWRSLEAAVDEGRSLHQMARTGFGFAVLFTILLLGLVSELVARSVADPLILVVGSAGEASVGISTTVQQQSATIQQTASSVTETTTTIEELRQTSEMTAMKSREVMVAAERSLTTADATLASARMGNEAMVGIRDDVSGIAERILDLSEKHTRISEIVTSVNEIAEQSNLLAVNASIEAAKAGDAGRGFAVVASEVRTLAAKSKEATRQIRLLLTDIQKASNAAVMVTEQGTKRVDEGAGLIAALGRSIEDFRAVIEENADMARQISLATRQQEGGLAQISVAMRAIDDASQESASGARDLERAAGQIQEVSRQVRRLVFGGV